MAISNKTRLASLWVGIAWVLVGCHKYSLDKARYDKDNYIADFKAYSEERDGNDDVETVKVLRNRVVYGLMSEIDDAYGQFARRLYAGKAGFAVAGDSVVLGLTAASTIATHAPTKTLLSALGSALTGVDLSVDKNFYAQQTFQTIGVAMQTRRDKARKTITDSLADNDDEDYSLESAKRDLLAYFYAGTLAGGLQELQEEAGKAAKDQSTNPIGAIH